MVWNYILGTKPSQLEWSRWHRTRMFWKKAQSRRMREEIKKGRIVDEQQIKALELSRVQWAMEKPCGEEAC